jgi:phospholipid/cholesterol/gamma-HCH transport system permease protein
MSINTFTRPVATAGHLFAYDLDAFRGIFRRPFQLREFLQQAWFVASVTIVPTALVAIPFGVAIALQVGGLTGPSSVRSRSPARRRSSQ